MQIKLLCSNSISNLEKITDEFLESLHHDVIKFDILNTVPNFEHRYIEMIVYDDFDDIIDEKCHEDGLNEILKYSNIVTDSDSKNTISALNKVKILHSNKIQDMELKINNYLNDIKSKVGDYPVTDIVNDIKIKQYEYTNCEYKYVAWITHDLVIINACS